MKYNKIINELGKHNWWSEEGPATIQTLLYPLHCFIEMSKVFHPKLLTISVFGYKNGYFYERSPEDEKYKIYKYVFEKMKQDKQYLNFHVLDTERKKKKYFKQGLQFIKNKEKMSNKEIAKSYSDFMDGYLDYLLYPGMIECVDIFTTYYLEDMVKNEINLSDTLLRDIIFVLSSFQKLSFMEDERIELLEIALIHYDDIKKNNLTVLLRRKLKEHSKKYYFILSNFKTIRYLGSNHFFNKCKEEVLKNRRKLQDELKSLKNKVNTLIKKEKEIYKKYKLSEDLKLHFKILKIMGGSIDNRKATMLATNYFIDNYCKEIAKRFKIDLSKLMIYTTEEIKKILLSGKKVDNKILRNRNHLGFFIMMRKKNGMESQWFYGKQAKAILDKTSIKFQNSDKIKGQVASSPVKKIKGKVQVIIDVSRDKFEKGNILVTTMTRPEFLPLMRKAKAIITDEVGLTSHASIISREMKIPCIIGTKFATRILKDNDKVEMDLEKGVVRKVK